jgi:hypothetical protein
MWSLSEQVHFIYTNYLFAIGVFLIMQYVVYQLPASIDGAKSKPRPEYMGAGGPLEEYESVATLLMATEGEESSRMEEAVI